MHDSLNLSVKTTAPNYREVFQGGVTGLLYIAVVITAKVLI